MIAEHVHVAVVGTGFSGLGAAIRLTQDGVEDLVVLERADGIGGTWRDNSYPGCACDVPSHLYSFSFAPNPNWTHTFSRRGEIWRYLRDCADRHGVRPRVRFGHELLEARWVDGEQRWHLDTSRGPLTADVLVAGTGGLSTPSVPALPGLERFRGTTFHSASWDHDHDLRGRRVAVVGTGASAIQFVPEIQREVGALTLFQRTAPWIMPRRDRPLTAWEQRTYRRFPAAQRAMREAIYWARETFVIPFMRPESRMAARAAGIAKAHLARQVPDRELRAKLTPDFKMGCKRTLISNDYLPALAQPNVAVVTEGIREVGEDAIVTRDGVRHAVDTIIFGTGFHVTDQPLADRVRGRAGATLAEAWQGSPKAHLGVTVAGFPNLFLLTGPNSGLGHTSVVVMIEAQIAHLVGALRHLRAHGLTTLEPREEAQAAFVAAVDRRMAGTVWTTGGCDSWYVDATGRNSTLWPGSTWPYRRRLERFRPQEYVLGAPAPEGAPAAEPVAA